MTKIKKLIVNFMAIFTVAGSMSIVGYASDTDPEIPKQVSETVSIGGFDCWVEDGNYFSTINGEKTLVIDMSDTAQLSKYVTIKEVRSTPTLTAYSSAYSKYEVNLSDGQEYNGKIDITNGDCSTPIFYISKSSPYNAFLFKTNYILSHTYSFTVYMDYADNYGYGMHGWYARNYVISFNLFNQNHRSFVLVEGDDFGGLCKFVFHKSGSTGNSKFNYTVTPVK